MRSLLLIAAVALSGCGTYAYSFHTDDAKHRQSVTERSAGEVVSVMIQGESSRDVEDLSIRADSTTWTNARTGAERTVATRRLRGVTFPGSDKSPMRSLAIGVGTGLLTGAAVGALSYEFPTGLIGSRDQATLYGAAGAGIVGGLIGLTVGRDRQSDDIFIARRQNAAPVPPAAPAAPIEPTASPEPVAPTEPTASVE